ncbi:MAG TPA: type II secretion system protein [Phycisphaerales bacterium]|nr:type II secretion system protein [Phycisphaerales bacterium]
MHRSVRRGLTLIDVVASLAVVTLLCAALVPAAVRSADQTRDQRENFTAKRMAKVLASYALDNADAVVPAAPHWGWVHPSTPSPGMPQMLPHDPYNANRRMQGSVSKVFTPHLIDGRGVRPDELQADPATAALFAMRSTQPSSLSGDIADYTILSAQAATMWSPSFGYNGVFIGGSYRHGAFLSSPTGVPANPASVHYVQRLSQVVAPDRLIGFAAARGGDIVNSGIFWSWGQSYPNMTPVRPGYWLVTPPQQSPSGVIAWSASNTFNAAQAPSTWGNLDCRAGNSKALVVQLDGSSQTLSISSLRDMRRWANQATSANWQWQGQPAVP